MKRFTHRIATLTLILMGLCTQAVNVLAGDDYLVIQRGTTQVGDNGFAVNPMIRTFILPANVNRSNATRPSAILQFSVRNTQDNYNEIYINPPSFICRPNSIDDNQSASIDLIEDYDADADMKDDYFTEHVTFSSNRLRAGTNTIMICSRNSGGGVSGSLDDFFIRNIALHYQITTFPIVIGSTVTSIP